MSCLLPVHLCGSRSNICYRLSEIAVAFLCLGLCLLIVGSGVGGAAAEGQRDGDAVETALSAQLAPATPLLLPILRGKEAAGGILHLTKLAL